MNHREARISKAFPISWISHSLNQYYPTCNEKYIHLDQGGELFNNPDVKNLLQSFGYTLHPTVVDTSHQYGPVERAHRTLDNYIRAILTEYNLDINFWPYALYHAILLSNSFP